MKRAISAAARKLHETQSTLDQLNAQIDEMNAFNCRKLEQQSQPSVIFAAQLTPPPPYTPAFSAYSSGGAESQRGQRLQAYFGYLNQSAPETIAELKQTRETGRHAKAELEEKQSQQQTLLG